MFGSIWVPCSVWLVPLFPVVCEWDGKPGGFTLPDGSRFFLARLMRNLAICLSDFAEAKTSRLWW